MHHYNTPRTRMHSPDQCSISYLFTPPTNLLPVRIMGYCNKRCQQVIMSTQHQDHILAWLWGYMHVSIVLPCIYNGIQSDFDQHNITHSTAWMVRQIILACTQSPSVVIVLWTHAVGVHHAQVNRCRRSRADNSQCQATWFMPTIKVRGVYHC